jgi:hypothetical protein
MRSYNSHSGASHDEFIFQKSGLKPPTSVGKDPTMRRRRFKPLNPSTSVGGGSISNQTLSLNKNTYTPLTAKSERFDVR